MPDYTNPQEFNRYAYVTNNPVNHTDPTGHCSDYIPCGDYEGPGTPESVKDGADLIVGFTPFISPINDAAVLFEGCGVGCQMTGIPDTPFDRGMAAVGLIAPLVGGKSIGQSVDSVAPGVRRLVDAAFTACNSFEAGTLVSTPDGLIPIEELEIGDWVLAYNEETGEIGEYQITDTMFHLDPLIVYLLIDGELVVTTPEHPFYTSENEWVNAGALVVGDEIRSLDWTVGEVESVYTVATPRLMYNLTVDTAHTFFVGEEEWLVHNSNGPCRFGGGQISEHGINLATKAKQSLRGISQFWPRRQSTVALTEINGKTYITVAGDSRAFSDIENYAKEMGYEFVANPKNTHAERLLYDTFNDAPGFSGIGVSQSPCDDLCKPFFEGIGYDEIYWSDEYIP